MICPNKQHLNGMGHQLSTQRVSCSAALVQLLLTSMAATGGWHPLLLPQDKGVLRCKWGNVRKASSNGRGKQCVPADAPAGAQLWQGRKLGAPQQTFGCSSHLQALIAYELDVVAAATGRLPNITEELWDKVSGNGRLTGASRHVRSQALLAATLAGGASEYGSRRARCWSKSRNQAACSLLCSGMAAVPPPVQQCCLCPSCQAAGTALPLCYSPAIHPNSHKRCVCATCT